jgi:hypothetical protein
MPARWSAAFPIGLSATIPEKFGNTIVRKIEELKLIKIYSERRCKKAFLYLG